MDTVVKRNMTNDDVQTLIGRNIISLDGIERRIVEITPSYQYPWLYVINEKDPDSDMGHFVHVLDVTRMWHEDSPPTQEERDACTRVAKKTVPGNLKAVEKHAKFKKLIME